jgi:hypothetical protein
MQIFVKLPNGGQITIDIGSRFESFDMRVETLRLFNFK